MSVNAIKDWQEQKKEISPPPSPKNIDKKKEAIRLACQLTQLGSRPKVLSIFRQASKYFGLISMVLPHLMKEQITGIKGYFKELSEDADDEKIKEECSYYLQIIDEFQRQNQKKKLLPSIKKKQKWYIILWKAVEFIFTIFCLVNAAYLIYQYNTSLSDALRNCAALEQRIKTQSVSLEEQKSITYMCEQVKCRRNSLEKNFCISLPIALAAGVLYFLNQIGLLQKCTKLVTKLFRNQQRGARVGGANTNPNPARTNQDPPQEQLIRRNIMKKKSKDTTQMNGKQMDENKLQ